MSEFVELRPHNINSKTIVEIVQVLRNGGLAIIPTDSIYAIVGDLLHRDVMEKICRLLEKKPSHANLSILCRDLCSSIHSEDEIQEYLTEPQEIFEVWQNKVAYIVDGEAGHNVGTTVIDASEGELELIREGLGIELL